MRLGPGEGFGIVPATGPMNTVQELLSVSLGVEGLTVGSILLAALYLVLGLLLARWAQAILGRLRTAVSERTIRGAILDALIIPTGWLIRVAGIWFALQVLPVDRDTFGNHVMLALTTFFGTWLGVRITDNLGQLWHDYAKTTEGTFDDQLVPIARSGFKVGFIIIGAIMVLQNLGFSVSSLLAGLGIGGAAVAFAAKDTVANFFGSLIIFIDRPFQVGDWIEIKDVEGTVEEVGLRVTRIRTFANSLISIPNAAFTTDPINNWSRMKKRRIKLLIGLTYDTTPEQMRQAVAAIREIIVGDPRLHHDFYLVNFHDFGASSLDIFCYLFTKTTNWSEHMQIREDFLLQVMGAVRGLGLSFAFPTTTVHLRHEERAGHRGISDPTHAPRGMNRDLPL